MTLPPQDHAPVVAATPDIPPGMPPSDPQAPKWALTQDQIDFLMDSVTKFWPAFKSFWPIIVMLAAGFGIGGAITGRVTAPTEKEIVTTDKQPVTVIVHPPEQMPGGTVSPIVGPTNQAVKIMVYSTGEAAATVSKIVTDPSLKSVQIVVDPKSYDPGSGYPFNGRTVPVPCMALVSVSTGKVLDVQPFPATAAEVAAFAKKEGK